MASSSSTDFESMLQDAQAAFGSSVTVRRQTVGAFDSTTMTRARTTEDVTTTAVRSERLVEPGSSSKQPVVEAIFDVRLSGFTGWTPSSGDLVLDGSETWYVHRVDTSVDQLNARLFCRNKAV